jgi:acyl-CoA synthetase (AMP-forming)/AMP-acid ligase II
MSQSTLIDIVLRQAQSPKEQLAYRYLREDETSGPLEEKTYQDLKRQARSIAAVLQEKITPSARVLLLYPSGLDFVVGFLGAIMAGVLVYPPDPARFQKSLERLRRIVADCTPEIVLTTRSNQEIAASMLSE